MLWSEPLIQGIIVKRYKRFLADVNIDSQIITAHVPNTGSMQSCWEPNWRCAVSRSPNPNRKLPLTLELISNGVTWIGVNTANANKLAKHWLSGQLLPEFAGYGSVRSEVKNGESRFDFFLEGHPVLPDCFVEVKNVTLKLDGRAQFPDSVSLRGQKHLRELMALRARGYRAAMLYVVQREDVALFSPAKELDPIYATLLSEAHAAGVEIAVYRCRMDLEGITLGDALPFELART